MTVTAYPIAHNIAFDSISDASSFDKFDESWLSLIEDLSEHAVIGKSITFPALEQGEFAVGMFTAFCSRIDFDYKCIIAEPDYSDTCIGIIAIPEDSSGVEDWYLNICYVTADWTHVFQEMSPKNYTFLIGATRGSSGGEIQGWFDNIEIVPSLHLSSYSIGPEYFQAPYGELILSAETPDFAQGNDVSCGELTVTPYSPNFGTPLMPIPAGVLSLVGRPPSGIWSVQVDKLATAKTIYSCVLTGAADGLSDLTLPMSSFQAWMRDGAPSYLSVVVPSSVTYAADIAARSNGEIVISKGYKFTDDTEQMEEIIRSNYDSIRVDRGARSDSLTMTGYKTTSSSAPKERTLDGVSYYGLQADGKRRVRADFDLFLRVGDTAIYGDGATDYFVVGTISYFVGAEPVQMIMEVGEA